MGRSSVSIVQLEEAVHCYFLYVDGVLHEKYLCKDTEMVAEARENAYRYILAALESSNEITNEVSGFSSVYNNVNNTTIHTWTIKSVYANRD